MKELVGILDRWLKDDGIRVQKNILHYALPPETKYNDYDEVYREYILQKKIFTVLIRKTGEEYWVRCGYKDSIESKTVEGLPNRDITSSRMSYIIDHCLANILKVCDVLDQ